MKHITFFFEKMFYNPDIWHRVVSFILLPVAFLYAFILLLRRLLSKKQTFSVPIVSIGNLALGGTGKTPFIIELVKRHKNTTVISRGYGRQSKGMVIVSKNGIVQTDVAQSGDEAMLIAKKTDATVIVSEDRIKAINYAIDLGTKAIYLDDGFSNVNINKYEILLHPLNLKNTFPLPSGAFREFSFCKKYADLNLYENKDYKRLVTITNPTEKMLLVTAIANPQRLNKYLPKNVVKKVYYHDHAYFDKEELLTLKSRCQATSILVTQKDLVKIDFDIDVSIMQLQLEINSDVLDMIDSMINEKKS